MATQAWAPARLPSRGALYDGAIPDGNIEIRKLKTEEEAVLQSQGVDVLTRINRIISSCAKLPNKFDPKELLITDRMAVLLAQRLLTLGARYSFTYQCRFCRTTNKHATDLAEDLSEVTPEDVIHAMEDAGVEDFVYTEPFELSLPDCGKTVTFRFLRGKDEHAIFSRAKRARFQSADSKDPSHLYRLAASIVAVDGGEPMRSHDKDRFIRELELRDSRYIAIETDRRETGINTKLYPTCRTCSADMEINLPFDGEFFQPTEL